ncbi:MAG: hypothetical protein Q8O40_03160 [Chloroflexota bacterium]|nr:hypothetical protein [Chloroflexota bacterium]
MPAFLTLVFCVHAAAFGYFFTRGRRLYNLVFMLGFLFLVSYYGVDAVRGQSVVWLRYTGLALVSAATVLFVVSRVKRSKAGRALPAEKP